MTPLGRHMREKANRNELNIDSFGAIVDEFLDNNDCQMLITFRKGNPVPEVTDNMGGGPVLTFYFILKAITPTFAELCNLISGKGTEGFDKEQLANALCELVKAEIMDV